MMSERHQTMSTQLGGEQAAKRLGLSLVAVTFGVFGLWAAIAPLDSAAIAPGVVIVENYRKTVQHLEGGIVKSIDVREGELVRRGQTVLTLEDTQPRSQLEVLKGRHYGAAAKEARLLAQRDQLPLVTYPAELLALRDDQRVLEAMRTQDQLFAARKTAHENEIAVHREQIKQLGAKARGQKAQKLSRDRLVASYRGELADFQSLLDEGYTEKQRVRELERNLAQNEGQQGALLSDIAATELQIAETELRILQLKKELQREVAKELESTQAELFELREKIQSLQDTVRRTMVQAPEAGMVLGLAVHTIGAVVQPGARIMDIVPQDEKLLVEAQVSPLDIDRVQVGQMAEVRFTAFKTRETPKIEGKLAQLSADRLLDEKRQDKPAYYLARVEVTPQGLGDLAQQNLQLLPGMPTEVLINTGSRTLMQYLLRPLGDSIARAFTED